MSRAFQVGARVVALVTAQGMTRGNAYEVVEVQKAMTILGGYTLYVIGGPGGERLSISNGHLVLKHGD